MKEFKTIIDLTRHFNNDRICVEYLEQQRWNGNPECPHCGSEHFSRVKTRLKSPDLEGYKDFRCKACDKKYSVLTGTIFESTKISLQKWFVAMYLLMSHKKGISSLQLAADLGITQKAAWHMLHRIRELFQTDAPDMISGTIEVDETYIGGKEQNKHKSKRNPKGTTGMVGKVPVAGLLKRGDKIKLFVLTEAKGATLKPLLMTGVTTGSTIITDGFGGYSGLHKHFKQHEIVAHDKDEYVRGEYHTNTIEGFWSLLKRSIYGIYHSVSKKHLHRYCTESAYRYNERGIANIEKFRLSFANCNKPLPYKVLINKHG